MGCASIAERKIIPSLEKLVDKFQLVAIASRTMSKAQAFAMKFDCEPVVGYEKLLERNDIDAIYMPLPTGFHDEWVLKSLEAGKHLLVEKSLAESFESAKKMIIKAKEKKLLLMEDFMFCYHSQHEFVRKLIDENQIGDLRLFRSSFGFPPLNKDNFRYYKRLGGGALLDAGAYTLKASQLFLGNGVKVIGAHLFQYNPSDIDLYGGALLKNQEGVISQVAFGFDNFYQCNYEIWGSTGKITVDRAFTPPPDMPPIIILEKQGKCKEMKVQPDDHFINILSDFASCINKQRFEPHWEASLNQARLIQEVMDISNDTR